MGTFESSEKEQYWIQRLREEVGARVLRTVDEYVRTNTQRIGKETSAFRKYLFSILIISTLSVIISSYTWWKAQQTIEHITARYEAQERRVENELQEFTEAQERRYEAQERRVEKLKELMDALVRRIERIEEKINPKKKAQE